MVGMGRECKGGKVWKEIRKIIRERKKGGRREGEKEVRKMVGRERNEGRKGEKINAKMN